MRTVTDKRLLRGVLVEALEAQSRRRTALEEQLAKCTSGNYFWKVICMVTLYRKYTRVVTFDDLCQSTHRVRLGRAQRRWLDEEKSSSIRRERVLFIGTQCSNLYISVDTPAKGRACGGVFVISCKYVLGQPQVS